MVLLFIGPPGSGKDTQAEILAESYGFHTISTGDLFRKEMEQGTELGKKVEGFMESGNLVPDDLVYGMLAAHMRELESDKLILNAVVRNTNQIGLLDNMLAELGQKLDKVIYFNLPEEEAVSRLLNRHREDDDEDTIRTRMRVQFRETIPPLLDVYRQRGILTEINASPTIEEVSAELADKLNLN